MKEADRQILPSRERRCRNRLVLFFLSSTATARCTSSTNCQHKTTTTRTTTRYGKLLSFKYLLDYTNKRSTNRVKPSCCFSFGRLPGLVVQLPPGVVPFLLPCRRESLPAVVAHHPGWSCETKTFAFPFFHLTKQTIKQSNKQTSNQSKKQTNKQTKSAQKKSFADFNFVQRRERKQKKTKTTFHCCCINKQKIEETRRLRARPN